MMKIRTSSRMILFPMGRVGSGTRRTGTRRPDPGQPEGGGTGCGDQKELANGEEPYTDCVEYVDETGNPIDGAPVTISLGKIEDHISLFGTDKNL